jgi:hypothetical protein
LHELRARESARGRKAEQHERGNARRLGAFGWQGQHGKGEQMRVARCSRERRRGRLGLGDDVQGRACGHVLLFEAPCSIYQAKPGQEHYTKYLHPSSLSPSY